jgi:hypothetical protein
VEQDLGHVIRDNPTLVGRRLPYLIYPLTRKTGLFSVPAPSLILAVFDGVFYLSRLRSFITLARVLHSIILQI